MSSKPKKNRTKQYLMLLTVAGLIAIVGGSSSGTFASFSAEVTNSGNYFAAGTLLLHQTDNQGPTICKSESDTANLNANNLSTNGCDVLFNVNPTSNPAPQWVHLTLANAGTLNASGISFGAPNGCTATAPASFTGTLAADVSSGTVSTITVTTASYTGSLSPGDTVQVNDPVTNESQTFAVTGATTTSGANTVIHVTGTATSNYTTTDVSTISAASTPFATAGALCGDLKIMVVETDSSFTAAWDSGTSTEHGAGVLGCAYGNTVTGSSPDLGCQFAGTPTTLADLPDPEASDPLADLGLTSEALSSTLNDGTQLTAGHSRYFLIGIQSEDLTNVAQNQKAKFALRWHIAQATS